MRSGVQRICGCGHRLPKGVRCLCEARRDAERKARFDKTRPSSSGRGYTGSWDRARAAFLAAHPWCRRCGQRAAVVDHITPHKGDQKLFWNTKNWQSLCTSCHSSAKQREERGTAEQRSAAEEEFLTANPKCWCGRPSYTVVGARVRKTFNNRIDKTNWRALCKRCVNNSLGARVPAIER